MAESSSESDPYPRSRGRHRRGRASGDGRISEKIDTLANTLEDTNRNLHHVDRMLGQYREQTEGQGGAMAALRDSLEESIQHLRNQRRGGTTLSPSPSLSTLHTSHLEGGYASEGHRYTPTSPLRDYGGSGATGRRRSRSASVRFQDSGDPEEHIHSLHQSLRDLHSDQRRLGDDMDREIHRRNRTDVEMRRAVESLSQHLQSSQREEHVSSRVERRLLEMEREMRSGRQALENRTEQRGSVSAQLHAAARKTETRAAGVEEDSRSRLLKLERDKDKMELELERARRQLDQAEGGREALLQQIEDLRLQLVKTEKERAEMQVHISHLASRQRSQSGLDDVARGLASAERSELERDVQELRLQLGRLSEVEELRRSLEQKERERVNLCKRLDALSCDLDGREQQQLKMLSQLKEIQARFEQGEAERALAARRLRQTEEERADSERRREELRGRAQGAVRQWKAKCKSLEKELEQRGQQEQQSADRAQQVCKEKESVQKQLHTVMQQAESLRLELGNVVGRLAQREEEVRSREAELNEVRVECGLLQARLQEEREALARGRDQDGATMLELQGTVKELSAARAELANRLAQEERAGRDATLQLQLEREERQRELDSLRAELQGKEQLEARLQQLQAEAASNKDLVRAHRRQVEKMKTECDKLTEELSRAEEGHMLLRKKYQLLKQEMGEKARVEVQGNEYLRSMENVTSDLQEQISRLEVERESILQAVGAEVNLACQALSRDADEKLKAISLNPGVVKDPHRWLAEAKSKLQWLCAEVKERQGQERKLRRHLQQCREQAKSLKHSRDREQQALLERIARQEKLLEDIHGEKRELLEKTRKKDEDIRSLQDRILDLEMSTRLALDHLESVPEKLCLLENFKDLEESQRQRQLVEQRYTKYRELVSDLQRHLEESKKRIQEYREEKLEATSRSIRLAALSSSIQSQNSSLGSSLLTDGISLHKRVASPEFDSLFEEVLSQTNSAKSQPANKDT